MPNTELFNKAELLDNFEGDEEFARSIMGDAVTEIPKEVALLRETCEGEDTQAIRLCAHTIKGMAANLCTPALQDIAFKIEAAARDAELETARSYMAMLEETARMTIEVIRGEE